MRNSTLTSIAYTHPSYTARTGVPTATQTPAFGGSFNVSQPVSDATGHITALTSRKITIPNTVASSSVAGLMSVAMYKKLANINVVTISWVETGLSGQAITKNYTDLGLTSGALYAFFVSNVNMDATTLTVIGASANEAKTQVRIYWDETVSNISCQFALVAIQIV